MRQDGSMFCVTVKWGVILRLARTLSAACLVYRHNPVIVLQFVMWARVSGDNSLFHVRALPGTKKTRTKLVPRKRQEEQIDSSDEEGVAGTGRSERSSVGTTAGKQQQPQQQSNDDKNKRQNSNRASHSARSTEPQMRYAINRVNGTMSMSGMARSFGEMRHHVTLN
jgi:hypothetical protein